MILVIDTAEFMLPRATDRINKKKIAGALFMAIQSEKKKSNGERHKNFSGRRNGKMEQERRNSEKTMTKLAEMLSC